MSTSDDSGEDFGGRNALVAEYVLGLLSSAEHDRVGRLIEDSQTLRAERDFWVSRFAALNAEFEETPVPPHLYASIEARAFGDVVKAGRPAASFWESLMVWRGIAAGALAVAAVAVGFNLMTPRFDADQMAVQLVAALQSQEGSGVEFVAFYDTAQSQVRIVSLAGTAVPQKDYELWYINADQPAVSMGVVPVDQRLEIPLDAETQAKIGPGTVLAVTLEQAGGSPTGVAQGPIVALGKAMAI
ncbi:anti-sigma factor [Devosia sp. SL43]|uniref:anti-sigma factor n=1 Tax=Devosia sp. SL43 TaxID=2806348 RepID=UPI001F01E52F|nr:anti-sigma factor [Devosia sp. SL43]UJW84752.1 anti-sigma factor [Devosia sp. SL43]